MSNLSEIILPNWPCPKTIKAFNTTRVGGKSLPPYASNNMGNHVEDSAPFVTANRKNMSEQVKLPNEPHWLEQVHGATCVTIENTPNRKADAAVTREVNQPLAILTADCLPILIADKEGKEIAAIHAGWRSLAGGIVESTLAQMHTPTSQLMAWLGPHICGQCFEVGEEVLPIFEKHYPFAREAFVPHKPGKFMASLSQISTNILQSHGIEAIYDSKICTVENPDLFFSYRRDGQTGRMASIICIVEPNDGTPLIY